MADDNNESEGPMERKTLQFQNFKAITSGDAEGTIEGYLSVFGNVDFDGDIVRKGAFKDSLREWAKLKMMPGMFWGHNYDEPIGEWTEMVEDDHGLFVKGRLWLRNATEAVRKAYNLARSNTLKGLSIGYRTVKYIIRDGDDGARVRELLKLKLGEGSVVPFAANELAFITNAKSLKWDGSPEDKQIIERILRDAGFSRREAKAFLAGGYKELQCDAAPSSSQEVESIKGSINQLRTLMKGD